MACEVEKSVRTAPNGEVNIEEVRAAKEVGISPNLDSKWSTRGTVAVVLIPELQVTLQAMLMAPKEQECWEEANMVARTSF